MAADGSVSGGISYTEREYDYAVSAGKTVLVFMHAAPDTLPATHVERDPAAAASLQAFRDKASQRRLVKMWTSRERLRADLIISLSMAFSESPAVGWIRGDAVASETLLLQMNALRNEIDALKSENETLRRNSAPALENLAGLDEVFEIRYSWSAYNEYRRRHDSFSDKLRLTWAQIFCAYGPTLIRPSSPGLLPFALKQYANDHSLLRDSSPTFSESDLNTVKIHLTALRLITTYAAEAKGGGVSEFVSLTESGQARLTELMAVRSSRATP